MSLTSLELTFEKSPLEKSPLEKSPLEKSLFSGKPASRGAGLGVVFIAFLVPFALAVAALIVCGTMLTRINDLEDQLRVYTRAGAVLSESPIAPAGFTTTSSLSTGSGGWALSPDLMPSPRSDLQTVACNGTIVVLGGLDANGTVRGEVWTYDAVYETYAAAAPMPKPRFRFGAACLSNRVYVAGGFENSTAGEMGWSLASCDVYDVAANSWAGARTCPDLRVARGDLAFAATAGQLHAIGGYDWNYKALDVHEVLSVHEAHVGASWAVAPPMPLAKGDVQAAVVGNRIFVPGGWGGPDMTFLNELAVYDPASAAWEEHTPMHAPRGDHAVIALDGRLLVLGGERWSGEELPASCAYAWGPECNVNLIPMHGVEMYDVEDDTWTELCPMPSSRFRFGAAPVSADSLFGAATPTGFHHSPSEGAILTFGGHEHGELAVSTNWNFHYVRRASLYVHSTVPRE
eukprot:jgi/Chrpa1/9551/Chrysochromulina_OHIO_Genome00022245-RA